MKKTLRLLPFILLLSVIFALAVTREAIAPAGPRISEFDAQRAYQDMIFQLDLGPRTPGSQAHAEVIQYVTSELVKAGWEVEVQETSWQGHPVRNVIAKRGIGPWIILGAHYDSRMVADRDPDPDRQTMAVPGANDAASGTAILLELARSLPADLESEIWLAFFDVEDQGDLPGWDWILGSSAMAASLPINPDKPQAVVIVDMVADADLNIYMERSSDPEITRQIWDTAAELGYQKYFIPEPKYSILDDHTPFLNREIPAVDIIDFDYPYFHTTQDTLDKVSADSLNVVGRTLLRWIMTRTESAQ